MHSASSFEWICRGGGQSRLEDMGGAALSMMAVAAELKATSAASKATQSYQFLSGPRSKEIGTIRKSHITQITFCKGYILKCTSVVARL